MVVDDGTGDELGEEGDEEGVFQQGEAGAFRVGEGVAEEGDLLEGVEGEADGEDDFGEPIGVAGPWGEDAEEEEGVFVVGEDGEVSEDGGVADPACGVSRGSPDGGGGEEVGEGEADEEEEEGRVPVAVEEVGGGEEPAEAEGFPAGEPA